MRLEGWNHIPEPYGARFDVKAAPRWLRLLFITPLLDRFAYPLLVRRGHGILVSPPGVAAEALPPAPSGWRVAAADEDDDWNGVVWLKPDA